VKVLLIGAGGQLGREISRSQPQDVELAPLDHEALDVTDGEAVARIVGRSAPDVIINAAAYTAVDRAESEEAEAFAVNAAAVGCLASSAAAAGCGLIHVSTDFVFDGSKRTAYAPTDTPRPMSAYGRSKLEGERLAAAALPGATIVRTSWLYSAYGRNFVTTMLGLMRQGRELRVVADQTGSPTWAAGLAEVLWRLAAGDERAGIWHWCDGGTCTWFDFACAIEEEARERGLLAAAVPIRPITSAEFPSAAVRPAMSALDSSATAAASGLEQVPWRVALARMLDEMRELEGNRG
jgi:dTDP-4-dehydrorhamnose reductase